MARHRRGRKIPVKPSIVVLSEDTGSVYTYLCRSIPKERGDKVVFKIVPVGKGPLGLSKMAKSALRGDERDLPKADLVLIVCDHDSSQHFDNLINNIHGSNGILCFVSTLCFETYFLLHYEVTNRSFNQQDNLLRYLKTKDGFSDYNKSSQSAPISVLSDLQSTALLNAEALRTRRRSSESKNPQTDVDLFMILVRALKAHGLAAIERFMHEHRSSFLSADSF